MEVVLPVIEWDKRSLDKKYDDIWFMYILKYKKWEKFAGALEEWEAAAEVAEEKEKYRKYRRGKWRCRIEVVKLGKFDEALVVHDEIVQAKRADAARRQEFLHMTDYVDTTEEE